MADLTGKVIAGRYRVDEFIGRGGMAEVYRVWDTRRNTTLAMKLLHADLALDRAFLRRFHREAETLARLQHPNIVRFYGLEQDGELSFMLMDYIEGRSLKQLIFNANGPLRFGQVLDIMRQLCQALQFAHYEGFVHSDVKPGNVLIDRAGRVMLNDFGIARMAQSSTATLGGAGTPVYMSPEQARGEKPSPLSDIYSMGIMLFEMLTGERPFNGEQSKARGTADDRVRWEQINLSPPSPRELNPEVTEALEAVILRALSKDPAERFPGALEMAQALEQSITAATEQPGATPAIGAGSPAAATTKTKRQSRSAGAAGAASRRTSTLVFGGLALVALGIAAAANSRSIMAFFRTPTGTPTVTPSSSPTPERPTLTPSPSPTRTPTAAAEASATWTPTVPLAMARDVNVNCRYGPGMEWESVSALTLGTAAEIVGKEADFNYQWWQIKDPLNAGSLCWVALSVTDSAGNVSAVPVVPLPIAEVTRVVVNAEVEFTACGSPNPVALGGRITTTGPATVRYEWEVEGGQSFKTEPASAVFDNFGAHSVSFPSDFSPDCGTYSITLRVLAPNPAVAEEGLIIPP